MEWREMIVGLLLTFVDDTFKTYRVNVSNYASYPVSQYPSGHQSIAVLPGQHFLRRGKAPRWEYVRITEKRRLETAAPAIKTKMVKRRMPLVFLPVLPLSNGSILDSMAGCVAVRVEGRRSMPHMWPATWSFKQGSSRHVILESCHDELVLFILEHQLWAEVY